MSERHLCYVIMPINFLYIFFYNEQTVTPLPPLPRLPNECHYAHLGHVDSVTMGVTIKHGRVGEIGIGDGKEVTNCKPSWGSLKQ